MRRSIGSFFIICIIAIVLTACGGTVAVRIEGEAMFPAFDDGDTVIMTNPGEIVRGDVIMFRYPKDETRSYIKRVIGLPGEKIEIKANKTYINGSSLDEPYINQVFNQAGSNFAERVIPNDNYFVMGDNRDNSSDSRSWGTLRKELITGKYYMTYSKPKEK